MFDGPPRCRIIRIRTYEHARQAERARNFQAGFQTGNAIAHAAKRWRNIVTDVSDFFGQESGADIVAYANDPDDDASTIQ